MDMLSKYIDYGSASIFNKIQVRYCNSSAFTVLELIVVLAIIGLVSAVVSTGYESWVVKRSFNNVYEDLQESISLLKSESLTRNTTTRFLLEDNNGTYTISAYYADSPTSVCSGSGSWTQIYSRELDLSSAYNISGTGVGNTCFYRDGSSSGATYDITPVNDDDGYQSANITVTISTGYIDASKSN